VDGDLEYLAKILQASISPMALISGVGLLILSLTNRFSRVTDRLRELAAFERNEPEVPHRSEQVRIFEARAEILRWSITSAVASVLVTSVLVLLLFSMAVLRLNLQLAVVALFACSLVFLITSLVLFLRDMHLSLRAVKEHLRA
jgi:hypothetical protein